jgi:hypothetical protein
MAAEHSYCHNGLYSLSLTPLPMVLEPFGPWPLFQFPNPIHRLPGQGIRSSQGHYLHTEQHKQNTCTQTDIHASSGIQTHNTSVQASEDSSCLSLRGHCDWLSG